MSGITDQQEEARKRKHEFILQYYNMAVKDLERHLKIGWETMTTIAGALVLLSTGYQDFLPIPIAVAGAISILFWGILNLIDADLWATRAIAFLANVEAVYLSKEDASNFNPYVGSHPPLKMMDSLKSQLFAAIFLLAISLIFFFWHVFQKVGDYTTFKSRIVQADFFEITFWALPILVFIILLHMSVRSRLKRFNDYKAFVEECPGPGLVQTNSEYRDVDMSGNFNAGNVEEGSKIQEKLASDLTKQIKDWNNVAWFTKLLQFVVPILLVFVIVFKQFIFG